MLGSGEVREVSVAEVRERARACRAEGKRWHFHALAPGCAFSQRPGSHALLLEDRTDGRSYVAYAEGDLVELSQELVRMLHGEAILDREQARASAGGEALRRVLSRAAELRGRGIAWHHHMLFPDCVLNRHPGLWNIVFEDGETGDVVEMLYEEQPLDDLRKIEVAYFETTDPDS